MGSVESHKTDALSWNQLEEGHWTRPLVGMEPYFVYFGNLTASLARGREHYIIYSIIKVQTVQELGIEDINLAWQLLRFEQPGIATTANASDWSLHYHVPDEDALQNWISQTFKVVRNGPAAKAYAELDPVHTAAIYWLPDSNELMFRLPHWQADGLGSWLLWDAFLEKLSNVQSAPQLKWGEEVSNLKPSLDAIWARGEANPKHAGKAGEMLMSWLTQVPGVGPPTMASCVGKSLKAELIFDEETTAKIIEKCHEQRISVTTAVHTAFILANNAVEQRIDEPKTAKYVSLTQFNLRKYLGERYEKSECAANVYYTPMPIITPVGHFKDMSQHIQDFYKGTFEDPQSMAQVTSQLTKAIFQLAQSPEFLAAPVPGDAMLSSLGVAERYLRRRYDGIEVVDLHQGVDVVMGLAMMSVYTFGDRLRLTYCYNEAAQDGGMIRRILDGTGDFLKQGLGL